MSERVEQETMCPETKKLMKELIRYEAVGHPHRVVLQCLALRAKTKHLQLFCPKRAAAVMFNADQRTMHRSSTILEN
ncbi:MAG: hypothetical protein ACHQ03_09380 [Candidatus Bathyarchaeia archaeon]